MTTKDGRSEFRWHCRSPGSQPTHPCLHASLRTLVAFTAENVIQFGQILAIRAGLDIDPDHMVEIQAATCLLWIPLHETINLSVVGYAFM